ncbi:MAG: LON peptidase substrate-binding domain-containing protein [Acidimicrobiia bacterium]|nr:LON peptidase substrate-binding domain-containing protein [Acidimicrobiia bacterium]
MRVLPMFPLGTVLLPGGVLPLQVFEPRYLEMTRRCLDGDREFGVVLIERGYEVGGGDVRSSFGTVARIVAAQQMGSARWMLVTVGSQRIKVLRWLPDDPFPQAEVEPWDDPVDAPSPSGQEYADLTALARRVIAQAAEMGWGGMDATVDFPDDPRLGTHHIAALAPLGAFDKQRVLGTEGAAARAALLTSLLEEQRQLLDAALGPDGDAEGGPDEG